MGQHFVPTGVSYFPATLFHPAPVLVIPGKGIDKIYELADVVLMEAWDDSTIFNIKGYETKSIVSTNHLGYYEEHLAQYGFCRVHRSFMVNPRYIEDIVNEKKPYLTLKAFTDKRIPIGKKYKDHLFDVFYLPPR